MKFLITGDFDNKSGLNEVTDIIHLTGYSRFFKSRSYGDGLACVSIILMCQDESLSLKQRIRYSKKDRTIYIDIMLDLVEYISASLDWRMKNTLHRIIDEMPPIIRKYNVKKFETEVFITDVINWFREHLPQYTD